MTPRAGFPVVNYLLVFHNAAFVYTYTPKAFLLVQIEDSD